MVKKHRAEHIVIFAVYKLFTLSGSRCRYFKIAFPDRDLAEKWIEEHCKNSLFTPSDFMVEEMPAIMKAWNGANS